MEIHAAGARKKTESRMDEIEGCMASFRTKLNPIDSRLDKLNRLDVDQVYSTMEQLPKVEESLLSLIRHLEARTLTYAPFVSVLGKEETEELPSGIEASGSSKEKEKERMGDREATPTATCALADKEVLLRKLEFPIFDGGNPNEWLFGAKRYFEINKLTLGEKLRAAIECLEGEALAWYYYENGKRGFRGWSNFRELLVERFRTLHDGTPLDKLFALRQNSTI